MPVAPAVFAAMLATGAVGPAGGALPHAPPVQAPLRVLALGDSYTIGEGIAADDRWPVALVRALRAAGLAIDADSPRIIARTGWTTEELSVAIDAADAQAPIARDHALVTLLIGVNDQYRGRDAADHARPFAALLERAIGFAGGHADRVLVLAIPDWGVTPFAAGSGRDTAAIARELDAYNAIAERLCAERGVAFVDIAPVSRARGGEPAMLAADGLHPSAALHAQWARLALPVATRLLGGARAPEHTAAPAGTHPPAGGAAP